MVFRILVFRVSGFFQTVEGQGLKMSSFGVPGLQKLGMAGVAGVGFRVYALDCYHGSPTTAQKTLSPKPLKHRFSLD